MAETSITKLAFELNDGTAFEVGALPGKLDSELKLEHDLVPVIQFSRYPVAGKQRMNLAINGEIEQMVVAAGGRDLTITRLQKRVHALEGAIDIKDRLILELRQAVDGKAGNPQ